ncbi:hypothetical protein NCC49_003275 [Naganishia albida]|nr:hypothetical protein NCC49_003275 [Naganishia albida]
MPTLDDLFATLDLHPGASQEDIKRAYRRLLLIYHPDKIASSPQGQSQDEDLARVIAITEAYRVLSSPVLREGYARSPRSESTDSKRQRNPTRTISLEEFTFHPSPSSATREALDDDDDHGAREGEGYYAHPCRCSGQYRISVRELEEGVDIVGCEGCGEWVGVGYEVVSDEDEGEESG